MLVEAFFCRQPDENHGRFYRYLLERNGRMYGVHFAVDDVGDVYLVGRLPLAAVSTPESDRVLGCVTAPGPKPRSDKPDFRDDHRSWRPGPP